MRKTKGASHENHERWLVSYADFITLLFAFFVVMFASSQTDKAHARAISQAIEKALKNGSLGPILTTMLNPRAELDHKTNALRLRQREWPSSATRILIPLTLTTLNRDAGETGV